MNEFHHINIELKILDPVCGCSQPGLPQPATSCHMKASFFLPSCCCRVHVESGTFSDQVIYIFLMNPKTGLCSANLCVLIDGGPLLLAGVTRRRGRWRIVPLPNFSNRNNLFFFFQPQRLIIGFISERLSQASKCLDYRCNSVSGGCEPHLPPPHLPTPTSRWRIGSISRQNRKMRE